MNINVEAFYLINNGLSNPFFDIIMPPLSDCGSLVSLSIICLIFLVLTRKNILNLGKYYRLVKLCILSLILTVIIASALKIAFHFPRPSLVLSHVNQLTTSVDPTSFPSGHTACSLSIVSVLFIKSKEFFKHYKLVSCLIVIFSVLIGFSRIYVGMHFPLDVIVGGGVGVLTGVVVCRYLKV